MRSITLSLLLYVFSLAWLLVGMQAPQPQSVEATSNFLEQSKDLTFSVTCLSSSSFKTPEKVELQIEFQNQNNQALSHLLNWENSSLTLPLSQKMVTYHKAAHAEMTFIGPLLSYEEHCTPTNEASKKHTLKGYALETSQYTSTFFQTSEGEHPLNDSTKQSLITSELSRSQENTKCLSLGKGGLKDYQLRFLRNVSIAAPPKDSLKIEFLME